MKRYFFTVFLLFFAFEVAFLPVFDMISWSTKYKIVAHFFKVSYVAIFIVVVLFHLFYRVKINEISLLFVLFSPIPIFIGLTTNDFGKVTFTHLYGLIIPILGTSFGVYFADYYYNNTQFKLLLNKLIKLSFWILGTIIAVYFTFVKTGIISYFGISSGMAYCTAYFLTNNNIFLANISVIFSVLTGKRVLLIQILFLYIVFFGYPTKKKITQYFKHRMSFGKKIVALFCLIAIGVVVYQNDLLRRFEYLNIFKNGLANISEYDIYLATGGRNLEIKSMMSHMRGKPLIFYVGGGIGEKYINYSLKGDEFMIKHYTHFSPMYFVLVYGIPFTLILYFFLFRLFFKSLKYSIYYFSLVFMMQFLSSFSGAIMMIDTKFWIFCGIGLYSVVYKPLMLKQN